MQVIVCLCWPEKVARGAMRESNPWDDGEGFAAASLVGMGGEGAWDLLLAETAEEVGDTADEAPAMAFLGK